MLTHWYSPLTPSSRLRASLQTLGIKRWQEPFEAPPTSTLAVYPLPHEVLGLPLITEALMMLATSRTRYGAIMANWRLECLDDSSLAQLIYGQATPSDFRSMQYPVPNALMATVSLEWLRQRRDVASAFTDLEADSCCIEHNFETSYCNALHSVITANSIEEAFKRETMRPAVLIDGPLEHDDNDILVLQLHQAQELMAYYYQYARIYKRRFSVACERLSWNRERLSWNRDQLRAHVELIQRQAKQIRKLFELVARMANQSSRDN